MDYGRRSMFALLLARRKLLGMHASIGLWQGKLRDGYKLARIWSSIKHTFVFA
ncbi:hypothetical protein T07_3243 [Trichinella nelsoni]|uniref:Uncharacterized protein n=1 Tax=Trichinella nelsoni TaxID=6336 RepID=A0A0V0RV43_9BILA|nr:hypothetical protein T07_3243 [Trichinella nelsoni]